MKRKTLAALAAILALALALSSCGAKSAETDGSYDRPWVGDMPGNSADAAPSEPEAPSGDWDGDNWSDVMDEAASAAKPTADLAEKMIYSASVTVETTDFEGAVRTVSDMLDRYGAFLESSSVSGKSYEAEYFGYNSYRTARYTIRVPVKNFTAMRDAMGDVGFVLNVETYNENITQRYYDVQSRLDAYTIEQERLMEILAKCETVSEMIEVESRLSQVRYEIESCETTLRGWQNDVDYSTLDVTVREVQEYTKVVEPNRSYWQQVGDGFRNSLKSLGSFFKSFFRGAVAALPVIAVLAVPVAVVTVIAVRSVKKRRSRRDESSDGDEK